LLLPGARLFLRTLYWRLVITLRALRRLRLRLLRPLPLLLSLGILRALRRLLLLRLLSLLRLRLLLLRLLLLLPKRVLCTWGRLLLRLWPVSALRLLLWLLRLTPSILVVALPLILRLGSRLLRLSLSRSLAQRILRTLGRLRRLLSGRLLSGWLWCGLLPGALRLRWGGRWLRRCGRGLRLRIGPPTPFLLPSGISLVPVALS